MRLSSLAVLTAVLLGAVSCQTAREKALVLEKERAFMQAKYDDNLRSRSCTTLRKSQLKQGSAAGGNVLHSQGGGGAKSSRRKRGVGDKDALYFTGGQFLRLKLSANRREVLLPAGEFSIEAWLKAEGGQQDQAMIIGLYDTCVPSKHLGWSLGISSPVPESKTDARLFFRFRTDRAKAETVIWAPSQYEPGVWVHVAVTYDGKRIKMYMNGAKVAVSVGQRGKAFTTVFRRCKELVIGGSYGDRTSYRGGMGALRLWGTARRHHQINADMYAFGYETIPDHLVIEDYFPDQSLWTSLGLKAPGHVTMSASPNTNSLGLSPPPCGQTVCDDPVVITAYQSEARLREMKTLRCRVINVVGGSDGENPTVSGEQIALQDQATRSMFKPYNINWQMEEVRIENATLREKTVLFGCEPAKVGDGFCNAECLHADTGWDGRDCDQHPPRCDFDKVGDGACDAACNTGYEFWDAGDCCFQGSRECFDPASPYRIYVSIDEYKQTVGLSGEANLNVFFANWTDESLLGVATLPWERTVFSVDGGVVVRPDAFGLPGRLKNLVHELGHVLGLWHVHYGVSEMSCADPCLETVASLALGDLCSDTAPTPENPTCRDPLPDTYSCSVTPHSQTPYNNFMSYSGENCSDHFTGQQVARMHCYADLVYQPWQSVRVPSPIPLPPQPVRASGDQVSLAWVGPLGTAGSAMDPICSQCLPDYSLQQYATSAYSPNPASSGGYSSPLQATGRPDSQECGASTWAWMPGLNDCSDDQCYIELYLKHPVVPTRLTLWLTWGSDQISHIQLIYSNGKVEDVLAVHAFCDMPWTMDVTASDVLEKVIVYVSSSFVGVDALSILSKSNVNQCKVCRPLRYEVTRDPPFSAAQGADTQHTNVEFFTDDDVKKNVVYKYTVTAVLGKKPGNPSPVLTYRHGQAFCGDGKVNSDLQEACDDGNRRDADGCNLNCMIEPGFHCQGEPSLCYHHLGDGVCEGFEERSSPEDCGYFTPPGYMDQWAHTAEADPVFQLSVCPIDVVLGPPKLPLICQSTVDSTIGWTPCGYLYDETFPWLRVFFETPVVASNVLVYLHSDGKSSYDMEPKKLNISLIREEDGELVPLVEEVVVHCQQNPMTISVSHELDKPFYLTKGVYLGLWSSRISVSGVALRSLRTSMPVIEGCLRDGLLYNPRTGRCVDYQCEAPTCAEPVLKHGTYTCPATTEGSVCTASCQNGHVVVKETRVMCVDGEWEGNVVCSAVDCGEPAMSHAKFDCPTGTAYGSRCKFDCRSPAKEQGEVNTLTCEADGLWSAPEGYCQVMCPGPPSVKNSTLVTKSCAASDQPVDTECKLKCDKGFEVEAGATGKRTMKWLCGEAGEWIGLGCSKVRCPPPDPLYHGLYSCTDGSFVNSTCTMKCPGPNGATSRNTCQSNGRWTREWESCKFPPGNCESPVTEEDIEFDCLSATIGGQCEVHCPPNRAPVLRRHAPAGSPTPSPDSPQQVDHILCTGSKTWFPPIDDIYCIEKCKSEFIGDGYCDGVNNKAMCSWDGGDCCPSTVPGGVVIPFPSTCTDACACKDPNSQEHKRDNSVKGRR